MSHRFFVPADRIAGDSVTFSADQSRQLRTVLRLRSGDSVRIFDGVEMLDHEVVLTSPASGRIDRTVPQRPEPRTRLVVYPALLQRDKFETVLQKVTEIGAAAVTPVLTARSLVREPPDEQRQTRWRAILREASEQSGRGRLPELWPALSLPDAVRRASGEGRAIMAYEGERRRSLKGALAGARGTISVFVGPEGGYEPAEAAVAEAAGARLITLGPRVLRTETASPLLVGLVLYELGDLSSPEDDDNNQP